MKKRVLVFPCGSEIGLEIYNSVNKSTHFQLYGLSSIDDHGRFVYENYIGGIGFYTDSNFIADLKIIIAKYNIDIIYPTMDSVISHLKFYEEELGVQIIGPSHEVAKICLSKKETYQILGETVRVPKIYSFHDKDLVFPLFIKPNIGYGSRNVSRVDNFSQLYSINQEGLILCEYLPGKEYTVDCFTGLNRDLLFIGARERKRTVNGISVNTKTSFELTEKFKKIANDINSKIQFFGAWFFQIKLDSFGNPTLLEIACRFAGSSAVHRIKGVNFALANLYLLNGIEPIFLINDFEVESDRALNNIFKIDVNFNTIFIDFDDTIIIDSKVNLDAISLIYFAINFNIEIILITKHKGNLDISLKKYKLENLFDSIIHLKENENKIDFILKMPHNKAIFIDDSFSERQQVFERVNIPVFSVDAIKSLVNSIRNE